MSDLAKKTMENGLEAMGDDEMEAVAGGVTAGGVTPSMAEALAKTDGRLIPFKKEDAKLARLVCSCSYEYKWARSDAVDSIVKLMKPKSGYSDIKCYRCGATKNAVISD